MKVIYPFLIGTSFILIHFLINRLIPVLTLEDKLVMLGPLDVIRFYIRFAESLSLGFFIMMTMIPFGSATRPRVLISRVYISGR